MSEPQRLFPTPEEREQEKRQHWDTTMRRLERGLSREAQAVILAHLRAENLLDSLLCGCIQSPLEGAEDDEDEYANRRFGDFDRGMNFHRKLALVAGLGLIPRPVDEAVAGLNALRNDFAHVADRQLAPNDLDKMQHWLGVASKELGDRIRVGEQQDQLRATLAGVLVTLENANENVSAELGAQDY